MPKRVNDGLKKRCECPRSKWAKCSHGWHFSYSRGKALNSEGKLAKREYRWSLDVIATKRGEPRPTTKAEALQWRNRLRAEADAGQHEPKAAAPDPAVFTFGALCDEYLRDHVRKDTRRPHGLEQMEGHIRLARSTEIAPGVTLENKEATAITADDLEALRMARLAATRARRGNKCKGGEVGTNRLLERLRHVFVWAIRKRRMKDTPFRIAHVTVVQTNGDAETPRDRRLIGDEEARLLQHANPRLYALIVAALTTGARSEEIVSMQWWQVRDTQAEIFIPAAKAIMERSRTVPIAPRLKAVLEMRRHAPDGKPHGPNAYVFGNECGERTQSVDRAWNVAKLKAHNHKPRYVVKVDSKGRKIHTANLTAECLDALCHIDLHFHDLRRECGSRWVEVGVSLVQVQAWLGHTNISQTSTYLGVSLTGTEAEKRRLETAPGFAHVSHKPPSDATDAATADQSETLVM